MTYRGRRNLEAQDGYLEVGPARLRWQSRVGYPLWALAQSRCSSGATSQPQ